jgi:D-methionine transport system ATP-binding protein
MTVLALDQVILAEALPVTLPEDDAQPSEAAILLAGVAKIYPGRKNAAAVTALADIDLAVRQGAIVGVIGPSGAGKSTLIRLVNGLEQASAGHVALFGRDVTGLDEAGWRKERRGIGMIFQHFNLLSSRTAAGNVALPLEIAGFSRAEITERVTRLLDLVGLSDKAERYPSELSGGQKQRVGIARALATEPRILLCDEATSALDPDATKAILALLKRVNRELGVTILLITHEIPVIKEICDEVAVIEGGRIVESGPVFEVFTAPRHPVTARFVEGVTSVETPGYLAERLRQKAGPAPAVGEQAVLRIDFIGENATAPVISRLSALVGADVNILAGRIDAIAGRPFGSLIVSLPHQAGEAEAATAALRRLGLKVKLLGFLSSEQGHTDVA